jgi:hypothetical protein
VSFWVRESSWRVCFGGSIRTFCAILSASCVFLDGIRFDFDILAFSIMPGRHVGAPSGRTHGSALVEGLLDGGHIHIDINPLVCRYSTIEEEVEGEDRQNDNNHDRYRGYVIAAVVTHKDLLPELTMPISFSFI